MGTSSCYYDHSLYWINSYLVNLLRKLYFKYLRVPRNGKKLPIATIIIAHPGSKIALKHQHRRPFSNRSIEMMLASHNYKKHGTI